jgi:hypothetical protein
LLALQLDEQGKPQLMKMDVVRNLRGKTVGGFALKNITPGAVIRSDSFRSYRKPLAEKWLHEYQAFDKNSDNLAWLHTLVSNAKSYLQGTFHGLPDRLLQSHLDEFCWRFNYRFQQESIFDSLLRNMMNGKPVRLSVVKG